MAVDISNVLHVLAHELRTPSGIAQGYLRMLLEDRLADPADTRRALEQAQKALARISELTQESSLLADWFDRRDRVAWRSVNARTLLTQAIAEGRIEPSPDVSADQIDVDVPTFDDGHLVSAVGSLIGATARELRGRPCAIRARLIDNRSFEILIGPAEDLQALAEGPDAERATALALERGGLGLSLITAVAVLEAHRASQWTVSDSRTTVGIRLPLEERAHL
ncbi:MAG TPA: histidine kinase dimerization/phospho-acceptor domain-containing protein [Vicinamibacterales bacterium]|nr:histidine kinase dimerization/phospho-acceptor domain-containing protein [Vicinamibacterales bacterium]